MEKIVYFPTEVLEMIFQQINHHQVLNLIPLHSKFCDIGQKKLYKFIHIYFKYYKIKNTSSGANEPKYTICTNWRMHKNVVNDFTKKFTVIQSYNFYSSSIENKIDRFQKVKHLSIETNDFLSFIKKSSFDHKTAASALLKKIVTYFKNIDYISFAAVNNQLEPNIYRSPKDALDVITFQRPKIHHEFFYRVLFYDSKNPLSYDFFYDNLRIFNYNFGGCCHFLKRYHHDDRDLGKCIDVFNKINMFKKLEELKLTFIDLIDLMDPLLLKKLHKINCKLKKLQILFWGKHKYLSDIWNERELHIKAKPRKWLNLYLSSHYLDMKLIDVSKLHKLTISTGVANDNLATEIAKLYFINPSLKLSWWPQFTTVYDHGKYVNPDNILMYTPDYFQIISCQWPLYFFKSTEILIEKEELVSHQQGKSGESKTPKKLHIILKNAYPLEELWELDLLDEDWVCKSVMKVLRKEESDWI
ncbi:uncharacterized protein KGF55_004271 [Candida pseudojiufengensis]|uniref:uncharacterized protein n=1 Tax=Candida pseudojiufengensis TaxID=497109 RepID=UPI0022254923|nr:uncharacterized protein KGF55_004271 [Candida pseudojiufengensis]KAI5961004.1 hypothetical protein KGF55_004271 [Candida pseudojiufengensis]